VPTVFTREEVAAILAQLTGMHHLMACLPSSFPPRVAPRPSPLGNP
jgi:hypothetical protein